MNDAQQLRHRQARLADAIPPNASTGGAAEVFGPVEVTDALGPLPSPPWPPGATGILARAVAVSGPDVPGSDLTFTQLGDKFVVANLGNGVVPAPSADVVLRSIAYAWNGQVAIFYDDH